jgi:dolichyl-phosphate-mannose-protein mannosyltransferase
MVPIAYLTAIQLNMSLKASILAATMVLLGKYTHPRTISLGSILFNKNQIDNAYLTISRFILLDSMLLFFTCTSLYTLTTFHNLRDQYVIDVYIS